jgi:phosphonate transport system substrate-binding protein
MLNHVLAFVATAVLSTLSAFSHAEVVPHAPAILKVSAIPDEAPTELIRKFQPLGAYLEQTLGMQVEFVPVTDYAGVVEALAADRVDMAWLGGFTYVQAHQRTGNARPLVQREEDKHFTSHFITANPSIQSVQDLKGKRFVFGSVSSTSGHLMPRHFMLKDGIMPEQFFSEVAFFRRTRCHCRLDTGRQSRRRRTERKCLEETGCQWQNRQQKSARVCHHT